VIVPAVSRPVDVIVPAVRSPPDVIEEVLDVVMGPDDESPPAPITAESDDIAIVFCPVCQKPPMSAAALLRQIR
jgi:hypothetical protein